MAYFKLLIRAIRGSFSRFLAIFAIAALGVGFLSGLLATTPDMQESADALYDRTQLMDLRVLSTLGLSDNDLTALANYPGVRTARGGKQVDLVVRCDGSERMAVTFHNLDKDNRAAFSSLDLLEGRWPEKPGECLAEADEMGGQRVQLGQTVVIQEENKDWEDSLNRSTYEVVGLVASPYYMSIDRESTSVGDGTISGILYVPEENFVTDYYTAVWMTLEGADVLNSFTDEYDELVDGVADGLEVLSETQRFDRYDAVKKETDDKIADAWDEYYEEKAKGEQELADAQKDIDEGEQELLDAQQKLKDAEADIADGDIQVADAEKELADAKLEIADGEQQVKDAEAELRDAEVQLQDAKDQLLDAETQLNDGKKELDDAKAQLDDAKKQLEDAQKEYDDGQKKFRMGLAGLDEGQKKLAQSRELLDQATQGLATIQGLIASGAIDPVTADALVKSFAQSQYGIAVNSVAELAGFIRKGEQEYAAGQQQLEDMEGVLYKAKKALKEGEQQLEDGKKEYEDGLREYEDGKKTYDENYQKYLDGKQEYEDGLREYNDGVRKVADAKKDLAQGRLDYEDGLKKLEDAKADLAQGKADYQQGLLDLADGQKKLEDGKKDYAEGQADFDREIADAERKLHDAEQEAEDRLRDPEWFILDRSKALATGGFASNAEKVNNIARVFPVFFFAIAALVSLTTMTRMVDEERTQIGTLKALGYEKSAISVKYLFYAASASLLGSVFGMLVGFRLFPHVIWGAYDILYRLPPLLTPFRWNLALSTTGVTVGAILLATFLTVRSSLKERPAALMQPKAPPPGKRILLERITPIWKHLSFSYKVTARNLFRYKKRMLMTIVGVAGCTALLLTGFGLQDSISGIISNQFQVLYEHNLEIRLEENWKDDHTFTEIMNDPQRISRHLAMYQTGITAFKGNTEIDLQLNVPEDADEINRHYLFRNRESGEPYLFREDSVFLTEKAAMRLGIEPGDILTVREDNRTLQFPVTAIVENYVMGFLYVGPAAWEQAVGSPAPESVFMVAEMLDEPDADVRARLGEDLLACDAASSLNFVLQTADSYNDILTAIDTIVLVLILCAGLLAFVVLYNLTNINVCERIKELATLKVLGFYQSETSAYVFRETFLLSLLGALTGLFLGVFLERFVVLQAEVDMMMFSRVIEVSSYWKSLILTMFFAVLVSLAMNKKLKNISMVESMKAPE